MPDRALLTLLFTDRVASTETATRLGDRGWRDLLEQHHAVVRRELSRFGGREIDTAGDGFFATFDGPARASRCARAVVDAARSLGSRSVLESIPAKSRSWRTRSPGSP